jgi:hypothetical protein
MAVYHAHPLWMFPFSDPSSNAGGGGHDLTDRAGLQTTAGQSSRTFEIHTEDSLTEHGDRRKARRQRKHRKKHGNIAAAQG